MYYTQEYNIQFRGEQPVTNRKKLRWIVAATIFIIVVGSIVLTTFLLVRKYQKKELIENPKEQEQKSKFNKTTPDDKNEAKDNENGVVNTEKENPDEKPQPVNEEEERENKKEEERLAEKESKKLAEEESKILAEEESKILAEEERENKEKEERLAEEESKRKQEEERLAEEERENKKDEESKILAEEESKRKQELERKENKRKQILAEEENKKQKELETQQKEKRRKIEEAKRLAEEKKQRINEYNDLANEMNDIKKSYKNLLDNKFFAAKKSFLYGNETFTSKYNKDLKNVLSFIDTDIIEIEKRAEKINDEVNLIKYFLTNENLPQVIALDTNLSKNLKGDEGTSKLLDFIKIQHTKQQTTGNAFKDFLNSISNMFKDKLKSIIYGKTTNNNVKHVNIDYSEQLTLESGEDLKNFKEKTKAVINYFTRDFKELIEPMCIDISNKLFDDLFVFNNDGTIFNTKNELNATKIISNLHELTTTQLYKCLKYNLMVILAGKVKADDFCKHETENYTQYIKNNGFIELTDENTPLLNI